MIVQVTTDNHIDCDQRLIGYVESVVKEALAEFGEQVRRVEVHLNDLNSDKKEGANDKRCLIEARLAGLQPLAATATADTIDQSIDLASERIRKELQHHLGRVHDRHPRVSAGGEIS